jgi:hypothetical protein
MGRKLLAGILGGLAFFAWSSLAHMVLGLGSIGFQEIPNEQVVMSAMKSTIPNHGLYLFPGLGLPPDASNAQMRAAMPAREQKVSTGPSGLLVYFPARQFNFLQALPIELGANIIQVLLAVFLLAQTSLSSFAARWRFLTVAGILAAITTNISYWNFYGFPGTYTLAHILTLAMGFLLAGLVAAAIVKPGRGMSTANAARA